LFPSFSVSALLYLVETELGFGPSGQRCKKSGHFIFGDENEAPGPAVVEVQDLLLKIQLLFSPHFISKVYCRLEGEDREEHPCFQALSTTDNYTNVLQI
jgi:hypothetical protein